MKKIVVYQEEISDCGVACLLSIIRYYNGDTNLEVLRMDSNTTSNGVSAYDLIECAKKNGFNAIGYKDKDIEKYTLPCILHIKINQSLTHFVTLYEINKDSYTIMDPAKGIIKVPKEELYKKYTDNLIVLEPLNKLPQKQNINIIKKELIIQLKNFKFKILKIIVFEIVIITLNILSGFYIKIFSYQKHLIILSVIFILISIFIELISFKTSKAINNLENKINYNLSDIFFKHILSLPLKYLHLKDPGEIVKRASEIRQINEILINIIISGIMDILLVLCVLPLLIILSLDVAVTISFTLTVIGIASSFMVKKLKKYSKNAIDAGTEYNNSLIDGVYGLSSIRHAQGEKYLNEKLNKNLSEKLSKEACYNLNLKKYNSLKNSMLSISRVAINIYLVYKIYHSGFSFEEFLIFNVLLELLINSSSNIILNFMEIAFMKNLFAKANDFYNIPNTNVTSNIMFENGDIKLKNINYNYTKNYPIIKNFTTTIKQGEKVIIKGESGSGKSTLCKMLYREINEFTGEITINGINITSIDTSSYYKNIIYSSQVERIFSASIKENILLGKNLTEQRLNEIVEICELNRIFKKRIFGIDSMLFSGGEELSGGERQLIILARALANDFSILILDETLSEINSDVENRVLKNIFEKYNDKTIIYITHKNVYDKFSRIINV